MIYLKKKRSEYFLYNNFKYNKKYKKLIFNKINLYLNNKIIKFNIIIINFKYNYKSNIFIINFLYKNISIKILLNNIFIYKIKKKYLVKNNIKIF